MTVKYSFYFIGLLVVFSACKNNEQEIDKLNEINYSLEVSTHAIENATHAFYNSIEEKLSDPRANEYAKIWQPKAIQVQTLSKDIFDYIENLKTELRDKAALKDSIPFSHKFDKKNTNAVFIIFKTENKSNELFEKLKKYKQEVLAIDSEINIQFNKTLPLTYYENYDDFNKLYFENSNAMSAVTILSKFQNNIRVAENNLITFCHSKSDRGVMIIDYFPQLLIGQNTNHLRTDETLQITAGIGSYSNEAKSHITINGKKIECFDGKADYKIKVSAKPGKHYIPVKVSFTDQNGVEQTQSTNVEYTVDE